MGKGKQTPYHGLVKMTANGPRWTGAVAFDPQKLAEPLRWRTPRRVFVDSMSDLFYEGFSNEQIAAVYGVMAATPHITYQVLTKRARRRREWYAWVGKHPDDGPQSNGPAMFCCRRAFDQLEWNPRLTPVNDPNMWPLPNVWEGASVENQDAADERIPELLATPAAVRFLSCEPMLDELDLLPWFDPTGACCGGFDGCSIAGTSDCPASASWRYTGPDGDDPSISWVIAGCESGPGARSCDVEWLRSLRDQCAEAEVAFFLKQASEELWPIDDDDPSEHAGIPPAHVPAPVACGPGSRRKPGGVIELPYLDGVQHAAFPANPGQNGDR